MSNKEYQVMLPVFKQGDDLASHLQETDRNNEKALLYLAEQYQEASNICKKLAGLAKEDALTITQADTHYIIVEGDVSRLEPLENDGILYHWSEEDDEDDFDYDEDDDFKD